MKVKSTFLILLLVVALIRPSFVRGETASCEINVNISSSLPTAIRYGNSVTVSYTYSKRTVGPVTRCEVTSTGIKVSGSLTLSSKSVSGNTITAKLRASSYGVGSATAEVRYYYCFYDESTNEEVCTETKSVTKSLGSTYSVGVPGYTLSVSPSQARRGETFDVTVSGLSEVDDNYGNLLVEAKAFGNTYTLYRKWRGTYSKTIAIPNVKKGDYQVIVSVTKEYGGIRETRYSNTIVRVLGSPPSVKLSGASFRKGSRLEVRVEEFDGDKVSGSITAFNGTINITGPDVYGLIVPHVKAGNYTISVTASDEDGTTHKEFTVVILGSPPKVRGNVPQKLHRGDSLTLEVVEDDGDEVSGELKFGPKRVALSGAGNVSISVPRDLLAGDYPLVVSVEDVDGITSTSWNVTVVNIAPEVSLSLSEQEAEPGDEITVTVKAQDDAEGLQVVLMVIETGEKFELGPSGGTVHYTVPQELSGPSLAPQSLSSLTFKALATDIDGNTSEDLATLFVDLNTSNTSGTAAGYSEANLTNQSSQTTESEGQSTTEEGGVTTPENGQALNLTKLIPPSGTDNGNASASNLGTIAEITGKQNSSYILIEVIGDKIVNSTVEVTATVVGEDEAYLYIKNPDKEIIAGKRVVGTGRLKVLLDKPGYWEAIGVIPEKDVVKVVEFIVLERPNVKAKVKSNKGEIAPTPRHVNSKKGAKEIIHPTEQMEDWALGGCIAPKRGSRLDPSLLIGFLLAVFILSVWRWKH